MQPKSESISRKDIVAKTFEYIQPKSDIGYMLSKVGTPSVKTNPVPVWMKRMNESVKWFYFVFFIMPVVFQSSYMLLHTCSFKTKLCDQSNSAPEELLWCKNLEFLSYLFR